jgi:hypothetical protein
MKNVPDCFMYVVYEVLFKQLGSLQQQQLGDELWAGTQLPNYQVCFSEQNYVLMRLVAVDATKQREPNTIYYTQPISPSCI